MDDDRKVPPVPETESAEKTGIAEGVTTLISSTVSSITASVKEAASSVAATIKIPAAISNQVETAHPPVEENLDAPPMTAEQIAEHAAADTQPAAKKAQKSASVESDEEVVVIPNPTPGIDLITPMPAMVAVVKKKPRKKPAVNTSGRITPTYDIPIPDTPLPTPKKAPKTPSRKPASKAKKAVAKSKAKKAVKKSAVKKPAKKAVKKTKKAASKKTAKKLAKKTAKKQRTAKTSVKTSLKKKTKSKK
jgi:hypothetical protein